MIKHYLLLLLLLASSFACANDKSLELKAAFELYSKSIAHERVKLHSHNFLSANFEVLFIKRTDEQLRENIESIKSRVSLIDYFSIVESSIEAIEEENAITLVGISKNYNKSKKLTYYFVHDTNKGWLIVLKVKLLSIHINQKTNNKSLNRTVTAPAFLVLSLRANLHQKFLHSVCLLARRYT